MPIPSPSIGNKKNAATLAALESLLTERTGLDWGNGVSPPSVPDTLIGSIIPYLVAEPREGRSTGLVQLMLQCQTSDQNLAEVNQVMLEWQEAISIWMEDARFEGFPGTYRGVELPGALTGIRPASIGSTGWSQISVLDKDERADLSGSVKVVRLLLNYEIRLDFTELLKRKDS